MTESFSSNIYKLCELMLKCHFFNCKKLDMKSIIRVNTNTHTKSLTPGMTHNNRSINANHNYFMVYLQSCQLQMIKVFIYNTKALQY